MGIGLHTIRNEADVRKAFPFGIMIEVEIKIMYGVKDPVV
jgi:hypothetical protein